MRQPENAWGRFQAAFCLQADYLTMNNIKLEHP